MVLKLESSAFARDGQIPPRYTCEGVDVSPPFSWSGTPAGTRGFAMICSDPDAPSGTFYHWAVYNIPPNASALNEAQATSRTSPFAHALNDFGREGYGGPCPPRGDRVHRYQFRLYAVDVTPLPVPGHSHCRDVERAARAHALIETELVGHFSR
jgi:Raf kinase inhibitor-like YbhB/YbcL family protein